MALIEGCKHELEITVPVEEVARETDKVASKIQAKAHLQGFRPGKAPLTMIRKYYSDRIRKDVLEQLLPVAFRKRAEEEHLDWVGTPDVTDVEFEEGRPLRFKVRFEVAPQVELGEYRGLTVTYSEPVVTDEEVEERLQKVRQERAEYPNIDPRPAETGDVAVVDLASIGGLEGEPVKASEMQIELGAEETMPGFNEGIPGLEPGDEKVIEIAYPEDYGQERLAGKTVQFRVTLKGLRRKELPELNDDFAKDVGDFQSLDELRATVKGNMFREREYLAQRKAKDALVTALVEAHDFPVPEAYVDRQVENYMDRFLHEQQEMGRDPKKLNIDFATFKNATRDRAVKEVKASLLLERISEREAIYATQEEVDREIQRYAKEHREPVAAVRKRFDENGTTRRIADAIRTEKTLGFLFENARKVAPEA